MRIQIISPRLSEVTQPLVISITIFLLVLAATLSMQAQTAPYDKATLIAGLKRNARDKLISQADFVRAIEKRAVDFQMTTRDEAQLRLAGATDEVIAAIRNNYRHVPKPLPKGTGSLTINSSMSDCKVLVNGLLRGTTDTNGVLTLPPLKADQYRILLKKENYEEQARVVQISAGVEATETFNLAPLKGSLTVVPVPATARVTIRGLEYRDGVRNLALEPGSYDVLISNDGYKSLERTVIISPGQPLTLPVVLEVLRVEDMLKESTASFQRRDFIKTIAKGREILAFFPTNAQAALLVGLAYYHSDKYSASVEFLKKAITLGEQVVLPIKHHHTAFLSDDLCTGRITVGRGTLAFSSTDRGGHDFIVPANKIYQLKFEPEKGGRVHVRVGVQKGKKEDKKTYNFQVIHAYLIPANPNDPSSIKFVRCNNCDEETQVIHQLLKQLKDFPYEPSKAAEPNEGGSGLPTLKPRPAQVESDDGAPGRPTLPRLPPTESDAGVEPKPGRDPELAFGGRENSQVGGRNWTRYKITVTNRTAYSDHMFASAPNLPPCGLNTKASRTWVDIFDRAGKRLNSFCALNSSDGLVSLWFALPEGQAPPSEVFIVITDRLSKKEYKSNLAAIP